MEIKLIYSHFVKEDLKEINDWYRKIDKKLLSNFIKEFRAKITFIKKNPLSAEIRYDDSRIVFLKNSLTEFIIFTMKIKNVIEIYSIFHTSRKPEHWTERK